MGVILIDIIAEAWRRGHRRDEGPRDIRDGRARDAR